MKNRILSVLVLMLVCFGIQASAQAKSRWNVDEAEYKETADKLFADYVPADEKAQKPLELYRAAKYEEALDAYRNYMMDKFVSMYWLFDDNYASKFIYDGKFSQPAKYVIGDWDADTLMTEFPSNYGNMRYFPANELLGDPYREINYDWAQGWADSYDDVLKDNVYNAPMHGFYHNILTGYYFITGDQRYIDKVMQVGSHFCKNGKAQADAYMAKYDAVGKDYGIFFTKNNTIPVLQLQGLVSMYLQDFMLISKYTAMDCEYLRTEFKEERISGTEMKNLLEMPCDLQLSGDDYEVIDSLKFAQIIDGVVHTIMPYIHENIQLSNFSVSNVKVSALKTELRATLILKDFSSLSSIFDGAVEESVKNIDQVAYRDGGFFEEHINYANGNYTSYMTQYMTLAYLGMDTNSKLMKAIDNLLENFRRYYVGTCSPVGLVMPIGNSPLRGYPAIWKDEAAYEKLKNSNGITDTSDYKPKIDESDRGYTSIYFPLTGAMVMRKDWKILTPMHFSMFTSNRRGAGHKSANTNAVWLSAYGRTLICSGNVHWYASGFAPVSQIGEFDKFNQYFTESSSFKSSTVVVNGLSQNTNNIEGMQANYAKQEPIKDMRWSSSDKFDFGEGLWDAGYGEGLSYPDATHLRQAIYAKDANAIIVTDTMTAEKKVNEYRQIWGFPEFLEGTDHTGFTDAQVVVDDKQKQIYTNDTQGPNVYLMQFSDENISYSKYYGSKKNDLGMYLGWGGNTYNAIIGRIPKADVHVKWSNSNTQNGNKSSMITILMPSENTECPYEYKKELSDKAKGISGFEMKSKTGTVLKYMCAAQNTEFVIDDIKANAEVLLVSYNDGKISGIALNCNSIAVNDNKISCSGSFEFEAADDGIKIINNIAVPETFEWGEGENGIYPIYSSNSGLSSEMIRNIKNYSGRISTLTNAESDEAKDIICEFVDYITENEAWLKNPEDETKQYMLKIAECAEKNNLHDEMQKILKLMNREK